MADDPEGKSFGALLGSLIWLAAVLSFVSWLVASLLYVVFPKVLFNGLHWLPLSLGFLALPFMIWEQYGSSLLMGLERIHTYNGYQVVGRTLSLAGVLVLVCWLGQGVAGVLQASLLGQIVVAFGGISILIKFAHSKGTHCRSDKTETFALLAGGAKLHANTIGGFLITSSNILIINYYCGSEQSGYFQIATQFLGVLMIIPASASMIIYGKVTSLGPNGAWPDNKRLLIQITLGMLALSAIAAMLAPWGITLLAGEKFRPAVPLFQWMLLGLIGMTFSTMMRPQWIGRGYFWQAAGVTCLVGVVNLVANFWLIPPHGVTGAIYASIGAYFFSVVVNGAMVWHCQIMSNAAREKSPLVSG
jgi:O-antigen/teichoic acid export membrane protein